jgi:hypothetical protein
MRWLTGASQIRDVEPLMRVLETIDRVFVIWFARYRRRLGEPTLRSAWNGASFRVSGYLMFPTVGSVLLGTLVIHGLFGIPVSRQAQLASQLAGVILMAVFIVLFDRRWKKFLSNPPEIAELESRSDKLLVWAFRTFAVMSALLVVVVILWLRPPA